MLRTLCDEGHARRDRLPALRPRPRRRALYRASSTRSRPRHPNVRVRPRLHARRRRRRARRPLRAASTSRGRSPRRAGAETFVCGPPALIDAVREHSGPRTASSAAARRELHAAQRSLLDGEAAEGTVRFAAAPASAANSGAARCSSRPRRPGSRPSSAAAWASATPAPAARRAGTVRNLLTGEVSTRRRRGDPALRHRPRRRRRRSTSEPTSTKGDRRHHDRQHRPAPRPPEQLDALRRRARRDPRSASSPTSASATPTTSAR